MKMIYCSSVPIVGLKAKPQRMNPGSGPTEIVDENGFLFWVKKKVADQISLDDELILICIPLPKLNMADEVLFLAKNTRPSITVLIGKGSYWEKLYFNNHLGLQ